MRSDPVGAGRPVVPSRLRSRHRRRLAGVLAAVACLLAGASCAGGGTGSAAAPSPPGAATVRPLPAPTTGPAAPAVPGLTIAAVQADLRHLGLTCTGRTPGGTADYECELVDRDVVQTVDIDRVGRHGVGKVEAISYRGTGPAQQRRLAAFFAGVARLPYTGARPHDAGVWAASSIDRYTHCENGEAPAEFRRRIGAASLDVTACTITVTLTLTPAR